MKFAFDKIGRDTRTISIKKKYYDLRPICPYEQKKPRPRERKMKTDLFLNNPCAESGDWFQFMKKHWN